MDALKAQLDTLSMQLNMLVISALVAVGCAFIAGYHVGRNRK